MPEETTIDINPTPIEKTTLTKRTYLGDGYYHLFTNDTTGEIVYIECTHDEYFAIPENSRKNTYPTLPGHTWRSSGGGTYKVDSPNGQLGINEYFELPDKLVVRSSEGNDEWKLLPKTAVDASGTVDINVSEILWL